MHTHIFQRSLSSINSFTLISTFKQIWTKHSPVQMHPLPNPRNLQTQGNSSRQKKTDKTMIRKKKSHLCFVAGVGWDWFDNIWCELMERRLVEAKILTSCSALTNSGMIFWHEAVLPPPISVTRACRPSFFNTAATDLTSSTWFCVHSRLVPEPSPSRY